MADDVARMMADLGIERRELVSTPLATNSGRLLIDDPQEQQAIAAQAEARRAAVLNSVQGGDAKDEHAARIRAWHSEDTFENDELAGQLENRYSGQGHRAALSGTHYDAQNEHVQNCFGEERALHLQQRAPSGGNNYTSSRPPTACQGSRSQHNHGHRDATPRSLTNNNVGGSNFLNRGRGPTHAPQNQNRAPSPRSFGTVRFAGGQRTSNRGPSSGADRPVNRPAATASPSSASNVYPNSNVSATQFAIPEWESSTNDSFYKRLCVLAVAQGSEDPSVQIAKKEALRSASEPSSETVDFYARHPDRLNQLRIAKKYLVATATRLADKAGDNDMVLGFLGRGPNRAWMLEAARKAKQHTENSAAQAETFYESHPEHREFLAAAKAVLKETHLQAPAGRSSQTNTSGVAGQTIRSTNMSSSATASAASAAAAATAAAAAARPAVAPGVTRPVTAAPADRSPTITTPAPGRPTTAASEARPVTTVTATDRRPSTASSAAAPSAAARSPAIRPAPPRPAITSAVTPAVTSAVAPAVISAVTPVVTPAVTSAVTPAVTSAVTPAVTSAVTSAVAPAVISAVTPAVTPAVISAITPAITDPTVPPPAATIPPPRPTSTPHALPNSFPAVTTTQPAAQLANGTNTNHTLTAHNPLSTTNGIRITTTLSQSISAANPASTRSSNSSVSTNISTTTPSARPGTLTASVFNYLGKLLDIKQVGVDAPVHMKVDITSTQAGYDPRQLISELEELGKRMSDASGGFEGFSMAEDGVFEEV